jgi:hypothetical protein
VRSIRLHSSNEHKVTRSSDKKREEPPTGQRGVISCADQVLAQGRHGLQATPMGAKPCAGRTQCKRIWFLGTSEASVMPFPKIKGHERDDVAPDRSTLWTVFRDTFRSRAITLIVLPLMKCSRRIRYQSSFN